MISDVILQLQPLQAAFPTLVQLLQIALTICVSSSQCERCFSALNRKHTLTGNEQMGTIGDVILQLQPLQAAFPTLVLLCKLH